MALDRGGSSSPQGYPLEPRPYLPRPGSPFRGAPNAHGWPDQADVLEALLAEYGGYCEALFERLARSHPARLAGLVADGSLPPGKLTYAAEALGLISDADLAARTLLPLLKHPTPVVREGAVYGLTRLPDRSDVKMALDETAAHDPSPGVREAAGESLAPDA